MSTMCSFIQPFESWNASEYWRVPVKSAFGSPSVHPTVSTESLTLGLIAMTSA